mmetsp:Transcript_4863/g.8749  ORF Transcript_4863/g.8749 Transcript_4863/m.8749 type:complete len:280 (+) Transcript_4863:244-1083(+)|eukprot:CAMPEP_0201629708 /NCGR_PEP_ID=MMETSP0493-20130528/4288_1 /ASSEMBLY_ACC=CAM_ASM_000838 /TAXON_ID=420259 /ORGANISM="Thalassiosira gravida, Strain GMp14c1" /LENGTH=279 /DNA_ID=CAMNT_0048100749 /DNA_START=215 /DNA_END=1054 /DNA_ORIENTATION=+
MDPTSLDHNNISMRVEPIRAQDQDTEAQQTCKNNEDNGCSRRRHRVSQPSPSMKRTKMNDVNFDSAAESHQGRKFRRRVTCDDTDTSPFAMGQNNVAQPTPSPIPSLSPEPHHQVALETDVALILAGFNSHLQQEDQAASDITPRLTSANHLKPCGNVIIDSIEVCQEGSYEDALQKLADSMKRTEWSRQQIMKQRAIIGAVVSPQYLQPCHTVDSVNQGSAANPDLSIECLSKLVSNKRFCAMDAFFSGSRDTLTNGLDHSRRQLKMHTDQMRNTQTL